MKPKNYEIELLSELPSDIEDMIQNGHVKDEADKGIICNYKKFVIAVKDETGAIIGALQAYTAFSEIYVDDIWVMPEYRKQNLGKKLLDELENKFKGKGYNNINLVTSHFQAPEFYKKCGFEIEFIRINNVNPLLSKTFFIKYFGDENQCQGIISKSKK